MRAKQVIQLAILLICAGGSLRAQTATHTMEKVDGIGGVFFRSKDPKGLATWYEKHLGMDPQTYPNGRFASLEDPEGNPIQLWEPKRPGS